MSKINVKQGDDKAPQPLVDKIMEGQTLPFVVQLSHKARKGLAIPSSGVAGVIPPGDPVPVKIRSADQAWLLVTDLATFARLGKNAADDFATIEMPAVKVEKAKKTTAAGGDAQ